MAHKRVVTTRILTYIVVATRKAGDHYKYSRRPIVSENVKLTNVDLLLYGMVAVNLGPAITPIIFVLEQKYFLVTGLFFHCLEHGTNFILFQ